VRRQEVEIINRLGLHARAAAKFAKCAAAFNSSVRAGAGGDLVDGKSIMSVMMLAAARGTRLQLEVHGEDEEEALAALITLIENRFDEPE
jgi:phosphocarrier protein